jgi:hypothetical protein
MILLTVRKDLKFYFAKTFLDISSKEKEETRKTDCIIKGIKSYDKYLRQSLNLQINDIEEDII